MKYWKSSRAAIAFEKYHPLVSALVVAGILTLKYGLQHEAADKYVGISYPTTKGPHQHHLKGWNDATFVFFMINVVTLIRFLYRKLFLDPLAKYLHFSRSLTLKFVDAGWFSLYYLVATAWGIYIFRDDEWWFNTRFLWDGYPHAMDYQMKQYYLVSLAFWLQCLLSFFFEAPRKDDGAYFFHHLLTISLIVSSYYFGYFRVGAAILIEQNLADVLYYHCKMFHYAKLDRVADVGWITFAITFFITRHVIFGYILKSLWFELPTYINKESWDAENGFYTPTLYVVFSVGLAALQCLMIFWFTMILRVAWGAISGGEMKDTTDMSDEEDEVEDKKNRAAIKAATQAKKAKNKKKN